MATLSGGIERRPLQLLIYPMLDNRIAHAAGDDTAYVGWSAANNRVAWQAYQDVAYAQRLRAAGVACELVIIPGAFHGFDTRGARVPAIANRCTETLFATA